MHASHKILLLLVSLFACCAPAFAQKSGAYDVFVPIAKYIREADAESLSVWFADNLDVSILSNSSNASRSQARQIIKSFFDSYTPRSFEIVHTAGRDKMKYALGNLSAGGEKFLITIFVGFKEESFHILQFKVERMQ